MIVRMNKLNTFFLLLTILLLSGASGTYAQDMPGSSSDACPCFDSKVIDDLQQSGDVECSFNIFKLEASPNPFFDTKLIAECDNCEYGTENCFCSITKVGASEPTTVTNLTESELKSCQALVTELLMSNGVECTVSSE